MKKNKIVIRKTKIRSKEEYVAKMVSRTIEKSKNIPVPKLRKHSEELFNQYIHERQSMRKAHALNKWVNFINQNV